MRRQVAVFATALAVGAALFLTGPATGAPSYEEAVGPTVMYKVIGPKTLADRDNIARTGASIDHIEHGIINITANKAEAKAIEKLGFRLEVEKVPNRNAGLEDGDVGLLDFPPADSMYHNLAESNAELDQIVADHGSIAQKFNIGNSYEGKPIYGVKISDNVAADENEPEVLFFANQHAREHLTTEQALYLANLLTNSYGSDTQVTNLVNGREFWIIPVFNPDGSSYDVATGSYRSWRKNRQPNAGSTNVGTDMNRNWGFNWGCCGGSSGSTGSETYRGPSAWSTPELQRLRDFVLSRRIGGVQQIKVSIDIHSYSELILWPMGYTSSNTTPEMNADQENMFRTIGNQMASSNNYTPEQASDLYITDGSSIDWLWANQGIAAFVFELYPTGGTGFYPPDEQIAPQTQRNKTAILLLSDYADCVYRAIGKEAQYCSNPNVVTVTNPGNKTGTVGTAITPLNNTATGGTTPYTWSATGLPAGLSINSSSGQITGTPTTAATYNVTVTATDSSSPTKSGSASFTWTISAVGTCNSPATNGTDVTVPDNTTVYSDIAISGCAGNGSTAATVEVHIVHTYRGDLVVSLVAPDGTAYTLLNRSGGSADNVNQTFTVNLSSEVRNGTWRLRVQDAASIDTGYINSWTLSL